MSHFQLDRDYMTETMCAAATEVFGTMLGIEVSPSETVPEPDVTSEDYSLVSLLGLTGEWKGIGGLYCTGACACWFASRMLFSEYPEVNDEVRDAVGEITNMIIGNFKNAIHARTGPLRMSIPTVICGRDMTARNGGAGSWTVFPFRTEEHAFRMIVRLQPAGHVISRTHEAMQHATASH